MKYLNQLLLVLLFSLTVQGQVSTKKNVIYILGGTNHIEQTADIEAGSLNLQFDYVRYFGKGFNIESTTFYSRDRIRNTNTGRTIGNTTFLEYYPTVKSKHVLPFVGIGLTVSQFSPPSIVSINPNFEAGIDFNIMKTQIEPYVQVALPDLNQAAKANYIGGGINIFRNFTDTFGLRLSLFAADNRWRNASHQRESGISYNAVGGLFYSF